MTTRPTLVAPVLAGVSILFLVGAATIRAIASHPSFAPESAKGSIFEHALGGAKDAIEAGRFPEAQEYIERALLRDPKSAEAWALKALWAEKIGDKDEQAFALHQQFRLLKMRKAPRAQLTELLARITAVDPIATDFLALKDKYLAELLKLGQQYEKEKRPHSAIRALRQVLALEPDHVEAQASIERISAKPDPSLAETAKPKDLLADVSEEWMREHDLEHATWKTRSKLERDNYVTQTDAGYEVMVRTGEAMEQMSRFYRRFFHYAEDVEKGGVPRIDVLIFKNRDEYLKLGSSPPEWSGGQYTGAAVETYIAETGFEGMVGVLFHEAAHQFVGLATSATGWLNEGLASFFEGTRILANGTVVMNMPANHRLFPLRDRMKNGWMKSWDDGVDPANPNQEPTTAPTWEIILENKYPWGPPWYAPTWGVVYFLYNYQDPLDGRFVYRAAFGEFINSSGGRVGEGAIENFEKVVLANPSKPTPGLDQKSGVPLPETCAELNEVWKQWMFDLADEQTGTKKDAGEKKPFLEWAQYALDRHDKEVATEHFEKGILQSPEDVDLLLAFATHLLNGLKNPDRASRVGLQALAVLESAPKLDEQKVDAVEDLLEQCDPKRSTIKRMRKELGESACSLAQRYIDSAYPLLAMDLSSRLGTELALPELFELYEKAARTTTKTIKRWQLAYNEENLGGWAGANRDIWKPYGAELLARVGEYEEGDDVDFSFLTYDKNTSGDYSFEAEVYAERSKSYFCGLVFGRKAEQTFHLLAFYPGHEKDEAKGRVLDRNGQVILATYFGAGASTDYYKNHVDTTRPGWHKLRVDVAGSTVDGWFDDKPVVTHEFDSDDVLRGPFGLLCGPGICRFRNVKFLARERNDLSAKVERRMRDEKGELKIGMRGERAPDLQVAKWLQGGFEHFEDLGPVPKLVVFWYIDGNAALRVDGWLNAVATNFKNTGIEIVSVAHWNDRERLEEYLKTHPFPGHVAVDQRLVSEEGRKGDTFAAYGIGKNLPRVVLLDVDDAVEWEGDPGFVGGVDWKPGAITYVDDPLAGLVQKRKLKELKAWLTKWRPAGAEALAVGDFDAVLPLLTQSLLLTGRASDVAEAQRFVHAVGGAIDDLPAFAAMLTERKADPALKTLLDWSAKLGFSPSKAITARPLAAAALTPAMKDFEAALRHVEAAKPKLAKEDPKKVLKQLQQTIEPLTGRFVSELVDSLRMAELSGDPEAARRALDGAKRLPGAWLAELFASP